MKVIHKIKDIQQDTLQRLRIAITKEVEARQAEGYEVDIQYSVVLPFNYTALVISYSFKEKGDGEDEKSL